jgi:hypothetical protein
LTITTLLYTYSGQGIEVHHSLPLSLPTERYFSEKIIMILKIAFVSSSCNFAIISSLSTLIVYAELEILGQVKSVSGGFARG